MQENIKFAYQDSLYSFPYHYLPSLDSGSHFRLHQHLSWGLDYMTYMSFTAGYIHKHGPRSLCDIGCGDGRLVQMLRNSVPRITGIDLSERAIAFARAFNPDAEIICGDIAELPQHYEMAVLVEVLEHIPSESMTTFISNVAHLLEPNGYLFVTVPTVNLPLNKKHYRHYNMQILEDTLTPHFQIENHWWLYRCGWREHFTKKLLCNRLYLLNYAPFLKLIWQTHKRFNYYASSTTGAHLACLARLK